MYTCCMETAQENGGFTFFLIKFHSYFLFYLTKSSHPQIFTPPFPLALNLRLMFKAKNICQK